MQQANLRRRGGQPGEGVISQNESGSEGFSVEQMPMLMGSQGTSCRDRTAEFRAICERLQKQQGKGPSGSGQLNEGPPKVLDDHAKSEFSKKASRIGLGIHATSTKLGKLAQLAKRTSMFDDPAQAIAELTMVIKQDISALNGAITELQEFSRQQSSYNKQNNEHSATVVDNLKTRLMTATKDFKEVLTLRTDNLKAHSERRNLFSKDTNKPGMGYKPLFGDQPSSSSNSNGTLQLGNSNGGLPSQGQSNGGGQQQLSLVAANTNALQSRQEALQNVESTIAELGGIFQQLATMVQEQGEMAIRIDENIDETMSNVDMAQTHLLKYLNRISSNRCLIMKIFFVLMVFLVIFVVFVA